MVGAKLHVSMDIEFPVYGLVFSYLKINTLLRRKQDSIPHFFFVMPKHQCCKARGSLNTHNYKLSSIQPFVYIVQSDQKKQPSYLAEELSCSDHVQKPLVLQILNL